MSASAIADKIQHQDVFANKKLQQKPQYEGKGALNSHPFSVLAPKSSTNLDKVDLDNPFNNDSGYFSNTTFGKSLSEEKKKDALDIQSIYGTPVGKGQPVEAADTPLPASVTKKSGNPPSKGSDDYDKVVKVIHDHISKELPKMPPQESKSVEGQKQHCCCGHKAAEAAAKESAATEKEGSESTEEKTFADESEGGGMEENDEGDDTVIVTLRATELVEDGGDEKDEAKAEEVEEEKK